MSSALVLGLTVLLGVTAAGASDQTAVTPSSGPTPAIRGAVDSEQAATLFALKAKTRFERLQFQPHRDSKPTVPKDRIVCGMRVLQVDPSIDRKMIIHPPKSAADMKIKRLEPPVCNE